MSGKKKVVEKYIEGFRRSDHEMILSCLTDDVTWVLHGYATLSGREAFDNEIENPATPGSPELTISQLIEEGDIVVAVGSGQVARRDGDPLRFVFSDIFTFRDDKIRRLETYQVNLS